MEHFFCEISLTFVYLKVGVRADEKLGQPGQCPELFPICPELTRKLGAICSEHAEL
jgi:hypothetical protein